MTDKIEGTEQAQDVAHGQVRLAYIKPTDNAEAHRLGLIPEGITLPEGAKLYVLHAGDGSVLGVTDAWDSAYGVAIQNEFVPLSVH